MFCAAAALLSAYLRRGGRVSPLSVVSVLGQRNNGVHGVGTYDVMWKHAGYRSNKFVLGWQRTSYLRGAPTRRYEHRRCSFSHRRCSRRTRQNCTRRARFPRRPPIRALAASRVFKGLEAAARAGRRAAVPRQGPVAAPSAEARARQRAAARRGARRARRRGRLDCDRQDGRAGAGAGGAGERARRPAAARRAVPRRHSRVGQPQSLGESRQQLYDVCRDESRRDCEKRRGRRRRLDDAAARPFHRGCATLCGQPSVLRVYACAARRSLASVYAFARAGAGGTRRYA